MTASLVCLKNLCVFWKKNRALSGSESKAAVEEFVTYVVDVRARHVSSGRSAEEIKNVVEFLLADYSFLSRKNLCRVLKLCCLVALKPRSDFPRVTIDLSNCAVPELVVTACVRGVQSCIAASNCKQSAFFTKQTMECVRDAIPGSQSFMDHASFNICSAEQSAFERRYMELFTAHLARKKTRINNFVMLIVMGRKHVPRVMLSHLQRCVVGVLLRVLLVIQLRIL